MPRDNEPKTFKEISQAIKDGETPSQSVATEASPKQHKLFTGFVPGQKPDETLKSGRSYLAYLSAIEIVDGNYGPMAKRYWTVLLLNKASGVWREVEMSDIASLTFTANSRFVRDLGSIAGKTVDDNTDLGTLPTEGFAMVTLGNSENINPKTDEPYLQITAVAPLPQGMVPPFDAPEMVGTIKRRLNPDFNETPF